MGALERVRVDVGAGDRVLEHDPKMFTAADFKDASSSGGEL